MYMSIFVIVAVAQLLSCVHLFAAPWTAALQASLSPTISQFALSWCVYIYIYIYKYTYMDIWIYMDLS